MRVSDKWHDYELVDCSEGKRLERWGHIYLIRPDPQIIWNTKKNDKLWRMASAEYFRSNKGGGRWEYYKKIPDKWTVSYDDMTFKISPKDFKNSGIFPAQAAIRD